MSDSPRWLSEASDREVALELSSVQTVRLSERSDAWVERLMLLENEVCARAGISLDETEQGLTPNAVVEINAWVKAHSG